MSSKLQLFGTSYSYVVVSTLRFPLAIQDHEG